MSELIARHQSSAISLYQISGGGKVQSFIVSTPQTRRISNDPTCAGCEYTDLLEQACCEVFKLQPVVLTEQETVVVNILRGGLNYGLRQAIAKAYGWRNHTTCFISAQRARNAGDSESWHITENDYEKVYFPETASLVIGDVVATGTSLRYALQELQLGAGEASFQIEENGLLVVREEATALGIDFFEDFLGLLAAEREEEDIAEADLLLHRAAQELLERVAQAGARSDDIADD